MLKFVHVQVLLDQLPGVIANASLASAGFEFNGLV